MADAVAADTGISKSAKRRMAKKSRDAAAAEEAEAPPAEAPAPKAKAQPKAKAATEAVAPAPEPKAKAKAKAKTLPSEEPKAEPKAKAKAKAKEEPEPKAKAKAKAKAEPQSEPKTEPKAPAKAKAEPKSAAAKAVVKSKAEPRAPEPEPKKEEAAVFVQMDDGTGGEWEVSTGLSKKQQKRKDKTEQEKVEAKEAAKMPAAQQRIPGAEGLLADPRAAAKAKAGGKAPVAAPAADQSVSAPIVAAARAAAEKEEKEKEGNTSTETIRVPEAKIGIIIGPKGAKIKMLQEKTGAKIDTTGEIFTIVGPPLAVKQAKTAIEELIDKGFTSLGWDDFAENFVLVHPSAFPDLIGSKGAVIMALKEKLEVEIGIPKNVPPPASGAVLKKKYPVTIAGETKNVEKAKQVINDICMYYHHEITHPDMVHEEIEVPDWCYGAIIGKNGSELKHIQNNYKVKMYIPREHSFNSNVVIVGEKLDVERAKAYVDKVLYNFQFAPRGRERVDDGDTWGEDKEHEDWMDAYMYKR